RKTLEMDPSNGQVLSGVGWAYLGKRMFEEAEAAMVKEVTAVGREPWVLTDLANVYAMSGQTRRALQVIDEMKEKEASKGKPLTGFTWLVPYLCLTMRDDRYRD